MSNKYQLSGIVVAPVFAFLIFSGVVVLVYKLGFFSPQSDSSSQATIVAASIALVGGLVSSIVAFIGYILKHNADQSTLRLQEDAEARLKCEQQWREKTELIDQQRLNVEAAFKGVSLLSTSTGEKVSDTQRAGVMLALAELDMWSLSLSLCELMLREKKLDIGTACWLLDKALRSSKPIIQQQAAIITGDFTELMIQDNGRAKFPAILIKEDIFNLNGEAFADGVFAMIDLILCQSYSSWNKNVLSQVLVSIHSVWKNDATDQDLKQTAGVALYRFTKGFQPEEILYWRTGNQMVKDLWQEVSEYENLALDGQLSNGVMRDDRAWQWVDNLRLNNKYDGSQGMLENS